jgi:hypothetical protein
MEQQGLYDNIDIGLELLDARNVPSLQTIVPAYVCPSTPTTFRQVAIRSRKIYLASSDYRGCIQVGVPRLISRDPTRSYSQGSLFHLSDNAYSVGYPLSDDQLSIRQPALSDITDGLSHTSIAVEDSPSGLMIPVHRTPEDYPWILAGSDNIVYVLSEDIDARTLYGMTIQSLIQPLALPPLYSAHPGGGFVAMCDASVRWISYDTRLIELVPLLTREAGDSGEMYEVILEGKQ